MAPATLVRKPRILFLDAYDSFSNNIIAQVTECIDAEVTQIHIDDPRFQGTSTHSFSEYLRSFDAVIVGPGPGSAEVETDVGLMNELWRLQESDLLPVLGICLGFQSLALAFGATIKKLAEGQHGLIHEILHNSQSIFKDVDELRATQYHSLQADIGHPIQTKRAVSYPGELWNITEQCPHLKPLAWDFEVSSNGAVLMAVQHTEKPFWGVQFHPESICTNAEGTRIIQNWWDCAQEWIRERNINARRAGIPTRIASDLDGHANDVETNMLASAAKSKDPPIEDFIKIMSDPGNVGLPHYPPSSVICETTGSGRLKVSDVCEVLGASMDEVIVLESGLQPDLLPLGVGTGRYSIIGLMPFGETPRFFWWGANGRLQLRDGEGCDQCALATRDPWKYLKEFMVHGKPAESPESRKCSPFWGGLMGYATYEAGLETVDVEHEKSADESTPDICFAWITRSIVIDHETKKLYVQSIRSNDEDWVSATKEQLYMAAYVKSQTSTPNATPLPKPDPFDTDHELNSYLASCEQHVQNSESYCATVQQCQNWIAAGHSYEICLTTQNSITARRPPTCINSRTDKHARLANNELSWKLYKRMTARNPAPFSAYIRINDMHILSSSPERYISWDRTQRASCRPIKGTVQKAPGVTSADAHEILSSSKERAENLMIVDLVRHQLHGVYGAGNVVVDQLMQVEEYETLWQLVSVVDTLPPVLDASCSKDERKKAEMLGFEAFVESLPPGSMTGAPKKRSCELLQVAEKKKRRGIYSGVIGYLDIGGAGDFSVVIRTAVKVETRDGDGDEEEDTWCIGAGGAITAQSDPTAEYEEMLGKFRSASRAFQPGEYMPRKVDGGVRGRYAMELALDLARRMEREGIDMWEVEEGSIDGDEIMEELEEFGEEGEEV
ncbi:para-aminobenzoate synthase [Sporormia fimetaria CBS 119925]|uniref:aminodeoxychorismate synthase n=1 Tax=Sporormia fimetaria CBS 119925 TaxID=1340428 RepID=A0A6A6V135_9PLEO|nr:para-aminobenzoate synthase [Sporormia fimetaria CBS 119925]